MANALFNLNAPSQIFSPLPKPLHDRKPKLLSSPPKCSQTSDTTQLNFNNSSRRASIGLATIAALFNQILPLRAEEENNGFWLNGPLPLPTITNKLDNEETGTRTFLRKRIYMANIGAQGSAYRLKHSAFDLLALGDMIGGDAWNYVRKYLCLKATFMYFDFDKVISAAPDEQKQPLLQLANRLFDSVEKLEDAVVKKNDSMTRSSYNDTTVILKEVMERMA